MRFKNNVISGEGASLTVFIDGREMQSVSAYPYASGKVSGVYETLSSVRPFSFSKLKLKGKNIHAII